jgi:2-phosphosulfolactate phosphatase
MPDLDGSNPSASQCRVEWGRRGAALAAERGDVLAIVDVLSFSTSAVTAASRGATTYPCKDEAEARAAADRFGAEIAVRRSQVPALGRFSLSPTTFLESSAADRVALLSPNGATCCRVGRSCPAVLVACLLNATAAARAAEALMARHGASLTVLACGERWTEPSDDGPLRFALEDYLGAGALLAAIDAALSAGVPVASPPDTPPMAVRLVAGQQNSVGAPIASPLVMSLSAEALVCRDAFLASRHNLAGLLDGCESGIELIERGWPQDVQLAARLDVTGVVPLLSDGWLQPARF